MGREGGTKRNGSYAERSCPAAFLISAPPADFRFRTAAVSWRRVAEWAGTECPGQGSRGTARPGPLSRGERGCPAPCRSALCVPLGRQLHRPRAAALLGAEGTRLCRTAARCPCVGQRGAARNPTGGEGNTDRRARSWICVARLQTDGWFLCVFLF